MQYVKNLQSEREGLAGQVMAIADRAAAEERSLTDSENASVDKMRTAIAGLDDELKRWGDAASAVRDYKRVEASLDAAEPETRESAAPRTPGEAFVASAAFRSWGGHGNSAKIDVGTLETRAPITSADWPVETVRLPPVETVHQTPLLDVLGRITISSGSFEWIEYPGAAPLAEIVPEGEVKPEAAMNFTPRSGTLDTVAHLLAASRQVLEDEAQLRSLIDVELRAGVLDRMELEAASAVTGVATPPVTGADWLTATRLAIGEVNKAGGSAQVCVMSPNDHAALDLEAVTAGSVVPSLGMTPWGLTYVSNGALPDGTAYVMDPSGASVYQRTNGVQLHATDSGVIGSLSLFERNLIGVLAEIRQKTVVKKPGLVVPTTIGAPLAATSGKK